MDSSAFDSPDPLRPVTRKLQDRPVDFDSTAPRSFSVSCGRLRVMRALWFLSYLTSPPVSVVARVIMSVLSVIQPHRIKCSGFFVIADKEPVSSAKNRAAGVWCRLYDLGHTFISALGEAGVPGSTLKAIAGWMSAEMLGRYSHTRHQAKQIGFNKLRRRRPKWFPFTPDGL